MKKPNKSYDVDEVQELIVELDKVEGFNEAISVVKEALNSYVLLHGVEKPQPEVYKDIEKEAFTLGYRVRALKEVINSFKCDLIYLPPLMSHNDPVIQQIARWRFKLGK
jgi:hypothetical protein